MQDRNDLELIQAYATSANEAAFAELVTRHRKMVYHVCLRMLGDVQEAEDAVQAAFLVLARKAASLRREGDLAGWLHRVARNVSFDVLRQRVRRAREKEAAMANAADMDLEADGEFRRSVLLSLDEALGGLPAPQRQAVILRYMEGYSQVESAKLAGCPVGTVMQRACRGLEKIRRSLERRGIALGGVALAGLLESEAQRAVPEALVSKVLASVKSAVAGGTAASSGVSGKVLALAKGTINAMFWSRVESVAMMAAAVTVISTGGILAVKTLASVENQAVVSVPAEESQNVDDGGPLADRPSSPGAHLDRIRSLGANSWVNLGRPAPDPEYGAAKGRAWSRKMAFAPDLRGAFVLGSGGYRIKTTPGGKRYYSDDVYFYDINAHAWVCCYPGTPLDAKGGFADGIKLDPVTRLNVDAGGNVVPVATSMHAFWCSEYDTDRGMFFFMPTTDPHGFLDNPSWSNPWAGGYSPYYYRGQSGRFERLKTAASASTPSVDTALFYSPKQKKAIYINRGVFSYDRKFNTWAKCNSEGAGDAFCYDSKRDQIYVIVAPKKNDNGILVATGANILKIYDIASARWSQPVTTGDPGKLAVSHQAFFTYDTVNDVAVLHVDNTHHIYKPQTRTWTVMPRTQGAGVDWVSSSGFYDPELNAHFYFNAIDGITEPGNIWVYRYAAPAPMVIR